jgi:FKBP-type peptidyl-prolyl cis-trans isomerase FkpA
MHKNRRIGESGNRRIRAPKERRIKLRFSVSPLLPFFLLLSSCHHNYPKDDKQQSAEVKEHLMNANKIIVKDESKDIEAFISHHQWKMQMTGTGLRIQIYEEGKGAKPDYKSTVGIAYKVYLLDGTLCYSADEQHPAKISLDANDLPRGLEEGLMQMAEGSKARMVLPYHLAFGITGDGDKIPPGRALYYDIHLIKVGN